mmetsp:Transcript_105719/g.284252  ORF Transcript_105719/g.284252 Transcript_105719/m.284252 type:complete len:299 (+) Transcript_105719:116-1012(+)
MQPSQAAWEDPVPQALNSARMGQTLTHDERPALKEEDLFTKFLGRKAKAPDSGPMKSSGMLKHRTCIDDGRPIAGTYDQEQYAVMPDNRSRARQAWQSGATDELVRSAVALILTPRAEDPPAPTKIAVCRKGEGGFKVAGTERVAMNTNQENFRFADARTPRGRSQPTPRRTGEYAGQPTGAPMQHMHEGGNPLTGRGKEQSDSLPLGKRSTSREHRTFRANASNESSGMSFLMNQEVVNESFEHEKTWRMQTEKSFADLCGHTAEMVMTSRSVADTFQASNGHKSCDSLKGQLVWEH